MDILNFNFCLNLWHYSQRIQGYYQYTIHWSSPLSWPISLRTSAKNGFESNSSVRSLCISTYSSLVFILDRSEHERWRFTVSCTSSTAEGLAVGTNHTSSLTATALVPRTWFYTHILSIIKWLICHTRIHCQFVVMLSIFYYKMQY